ncbi:3-oxoacyl-ACP reductase [Rugamonas apoptosis]|uniref:3-oxoacyl-ACP reductase n=1 Tax=Rugamonas apoptosis TaxID=2758570 RepID=A0A7W2II95_9BURK|nr:3-oxoacyl-ACP reductase [Rugamonas apoptosis]MBA5685485.1 3-oxoacyl-ACP reductase [Rugamonas apoptosis]
MADMLIKLHRNPLTSRLVKALGVPNPVTLARADGGYTARPFEGKHALLCRSAGGYAADALRRALADAGASHVDQLPADSTVRADLVVMDATGCAAPDDYRALYDAFHPIMRRIARNGRVLLVAASPEACATPAAMAVSRGMEGFVRSLAKELGAKGITVNQLYVERGALERLPGPLRFFCGAQSTYVTGQVLHVTAQVTAPAATPFSKALAGKVALVTGAARGIGRATAERLAQEGATVVALDVPAAEEELRRVCGAFGGVPLAMDIASPAAPQQLAAFLGERFGGVDIVVHNAGVTRDKTLANMTQPQWELVMQINLAAVMAIDAHLLERGLVKRDGRIVCLSSVSGVAGNFGQTNYATSKAALIGYVAAQAPLLAPRGICINAVAPGFIQTAMTEQMPFMTREIGRRLNSLKQAGLPRDVAELITFLSTPGASGITGNTVRVCGQGLIGA